MNEKSASKVLIILIKQNIIKYFLLKNVKYDPKLNRLQLKKKNGMHIITRLNWNKTFKKENMKLNMNIYCLVISWHKGNIVVDSKHLLYEILIAHDIVQGLQ